MMGPRALFARGPRLADGTSAGTPRERMAMPDRLLHRDRLKRRAMVTAVLVAEPIRCVECGICTFNCPLGIDIRAKVRLGQPVGDHHCLTCGECVARCPRGTLRFEVSTLFRIDSLRGDG
jgi:heterodisulfide reductase subunit C